MPFSWGCYVLGATLTSFLAPCFPAILRSMNVGLRAQRKFPLIPLLCVSDKFPFAQEVPLFYPMFWSPGAPASSSVQESGPHPVQHSEYRSRQGLQGLEEIPRVESCLSFLPGFLLSLSHDLSRSFPFVLTQKCVLKGAYLP